MKRIEIFLLLTMTMLHVAAQQYAREDSLRIVELLTEAKNMTQAPEQPNWMLHFGRKLCGTPYVAKTLEKNAEEQLVVNLQELDCTTFVENALALTLCMKHHCMTFKDFCRYLQDIRYRNGHVDYPARLHYFSDWIADNERMGYVKEVNEPCPPFTGVQTLSIDYMTTHVSQYPMLAGHPEWVEEIGHCEQMLSGKQCPFIPKGELANSELYWDAIHDGDIIAIVTNKKGLDTSHIGIAVWHVDGIHLLNASMIHKKVVEEPMTMRQYMQKHPSQVGIRIIRIK